MSFNHCNGSEVQKVYTEQKNYIIEINPNITPAVTVVYFSSNGIYFPNTLECFTDTILKKNRFEWSNKLNQIPFASKSIFVRDVFKQWYIKGINSEINDLDKLIEFIRSESQDSKLICVGSSAGGYVATLVGSILNAEAIFTFSGQFTLLPWVQKGNNHLLTEFQTKWQHYYTLASVLKLTHAKIFYFASSHSDMDKEDIEFSKQFDSIYPFMFSSTIHGIPFREFLLPKLLSTETSKLIALSKLNRATVFNTKTLGKCIDSFVGYHSAHAQYIFRKIKKIPAYILKKVRKGS